jgi:hypothetical protein
VMMSLDIMKSIAYLKFAGITNAVQEKH